MTANGCGHVHAGVSLGYLVVGGQVMALALALVPVLDWAALYQHHGGLARFSVQSMVLCRL
ncbi:hypothetical protein BO70DRAFT_366038 [Aspergillus heteromorphus CBS 117.55]|uniref:Uncharacterized protein n=1 Tax=Aspergillus heteromorphus CBS 117.55 TaxID=1448321 RepID=A0A317V9K7_9EURO|nr:uncharacterized protein BO70DRAFT_366038 [Aspergillus heteromorphus CBS 117.55]PWY68670.1 hypothetical protein BO70DRAFT_366038 [Aspergillus heteromorphus CBS 117.55]